MIYYELIHVMYFEFIHVIYYEFILQRCAVGTVQILAMHLQRRPAIIGINCNYFILFFFQLGYLYFCNDLFSVYNALQIVKIKYL